MESWPASQLAGWPVAQLVLVALLPQAIIFLFEHLVNLGGESARRQKRREEVAAIDHPQYIRYHVLLPQHTALKFARKRLLARDRASIGDPQSLKQRDDQLGQGPNTMTNLDLL